jgi:hemoglobin
LLFTPQTLGSQAVGTTLYERVGGGEWFVALVARFYAAVETEPVLRPLYPSDLRESESHLALFLAQYFGGPRHYDELRGHPKLRMRHARFSIGVDEHDAWLRCMTAAVRAGGLGDADEADVLAYFTSAARMLRNDETMPAGMGLPAGARRLKLVPPG